MCFQLPENHTVKLRNSRSVPVSCIWFTAWRWEHIVSAIAKVVDTGVDKVLQDVHLATIDTALPICKSRTSTQSDLPRAPAVATATSVRRNVTNWPYHRNCCRIKDAPWLQCPVISAGKRSPEAVSSNRTTRAVKAPQSSTFVFELEYSQLNEWASTPTPSEFISPPKQCIWYRYNLQLWPLTLKTFSTMPTHMTNIYDKFHWNPSSNNISIP